MKKHSCGIILFHKPSNTFLLGKVTSFKEYSIPKGGIEDGETHLQCAFRECYEECGVDRNFLTQYPIYELGSFQYPNKTKTLHCFLCIMDEKPKNIQCNSTFTTKDGRQLPELSNFVWADALDCQYPIHISQKQALQKALSILKLKTNDPSKEI